MIPFVEKEIASSIPILTDFSFSLILLTLLRVRYEALVHHDLGKLQTEPFGEFLHAHGNC
jgi:hypothetical protein